MGKSHYVIGLQASPHAIEAADWDALLQAQDRPTPFMRHAYLCALHNSASACEATGWLPHWLTLHDEQGLAGACLVYAKTHSYGEYVFDWAWANAYQQHGMAYYPKALVATPFTPVPSSRLLARTPADRLALVRALVDWSAQCGLSSLHLLFLAPQDIAACSQAGLMLRHTVQFHWNNSTPPYANFEAFLASLTQEKRKKIRQERRKVNDAGVHFRAVQGAQISHAEWDFFYRCYERTYYEHGNAPYLSRDFFTRVAQALPEHWLLLIAERQGRAIACSLIALSPQDKVAYGRYWGALERVDCLHFEACYYQPLEWCIAHGYQRFEGGAQGEHKMARALLPTKTTSAHWIGDAAFADAINRFLLREAQGVENYMEELQHHSPLRSSPHA